MLVLWRYEWRRVGRPARVAPPAALLATVSFAVAFSAADASRAQVTRLLLSGLEAIMPLAVGMAALAAVGDRCRELQLSLPVRHTATLARRLCLLAGTAALQCLTFSGVLGLTGRWGGPGPAAATLVWAAPLAYLGGLSVVLAVATRSVVFASSAAGLAWIGEQLFAARFMDDPWLRPFFLFFTTRVGTGTGWLTNRLVLLSSGLVFLLVSGVLMARPERLLGGEEEV